MIGFNSHLTIENADDEVFDWIKNQNKVQTVYEIQDYQALIEGPEGNLLPLKLRAIDELVLKNNLKIKVHDFLDPLDDLPLSEKKFLSERSGLPGIIFGESFFSSQIFIPGAKEVLKVIVPFSDIGPNGEMISSQRNFLLNGLFSTGYYNFDKNYAMVSLDQSEFLSSSIRKQVHVLLHNESDSKAFKKELLKKFEGLEIKTWFEENQKLLGGLKLEEFSVSLILSLVLLMACFSIFSFMNLLSLSKKRELALLYALGFGSKDIKSLLSRISLFLGLIGTLSAALVAVLLSLYLKYNPLPLPSAYYVESLPVQIDLKTLVIVILMGPLFSYIASVWPVKKICNFDHIESLRRVD